MNVHQVNLHHSTVHHVSQIDKAADAPHATCTPDAAPRLAGGFAGMLRLSLGQTNFSLSGPARNDSSKIWLCFMFVLSCRFIDEGGHPDDFVRNLFVTGVVDTQLAAGKVAAVKAMRESLAAAAGGAYPEAATAYRLVPLCPADHAVHSQTTAVVIKHVTMTESGTVFLLAQGCTL